MKENVSKEMESMRGNDGSGGSDGNSKAKREVVTPTPPPQPPVIFSLNIIYTYYSIILVCH